jgi:TfoX/Sxy family transcriptional regulator of competence genes
MPYNEKLADRIREALVDLHDVEEKEMFRGVTFMVKGKMCVTVSGDELMCRIDPDIQDEALKKKSSRIVIMKGTPINGWIKVSEEGIKNKKDLDYWIGLALNFNKKAKASKKRAATTKKFK